jgi:deazaflavin-dependent oxidoreductase (nitroreductase family)
VVIAMRYDQVNLFYRWMRRLAGTAPMSFIYARTLHHLDRLVFRLTRQRHTFASWVSGLPVVMLTTTGARTGQPRTLPVLGLPDGDRIAVIASNYGQRHHPSWYHNLRAHQAATVGVDGVAWQARAREVTGEERERLWRLGLEIYPAWSAYEKRAANRRIPIMVLTPVHGPAPWPARVAEGA